MPGAIACVETFGARVLINTIVFGDWGTGARAYCKRCYSGKGSNSMKL